MLTAVPPCRLSLHADDKAGHVGGATKLRPYAHPGDYWLGERLWQADLMQRLKSLQQLKRTRTMGRLGHSKLS